MIPVSINNRTSYDYFGFKTFFIYCSLLLTMSAYGICINCILTECCPYTKATQNVGHDH